MSKRWILILMSMPLLQLSCSDLLINSLTAQVQLAVNGIVGGVIQTVLSNVFGVPTT